MLTDTKGYAIRSIQDVRLSLYLKAKDLFKVRPDGIKTIADLAKHLVLKGVDLRKVWYRLPEEVCFYADEAV